MLQLFERRASCNEALVAAAALPLEELLVLAAGADPHPSPTPSPHAGKDAPVAAAEADAAMLATPNPGSAPVAAPSEAHASHSEVAPGVAEARVGVAEAAVTAVHDAANLAQAPDLVPAAVQRTLLLPLAGAAGAAGKSQIWRGTRLRVCIGYGAVHLPGGDGGEAVGAVHGEAAGGEGVWMGLGTCCDSPAPWVEGACPSGGCSCSGGSGSDAGRGTVDRLCCAPEADVACSVSAACERLKHPSVVVPAWRACCLHALWNL